MYAAKSTAAVLFAAAAADLFCFFGSCGVFSAFARTACFFLFSVMCFGEGGDPLLQRRCSPPSPTPSLLSSTGTRRSTASRKHTAANVRLYNKLKICRWLNFILPVAKFNFAVYPVRILPSASETLAIGKRFICRRQTKNLQSASAPLAIGKIHV